MTESTEKSAGGPAEFNPQFSVESFTAGKDPQRNEDIVSIGENYIAVFDGATDKTGLRFAENKETGEYRTGGEIAARIAAGVVKHSDNYGYALIAEITEKLQSYCGKFNPKAANDSAYRFASAMLVARIVDDKLIITQVDSTWFRLNGNAVYTNVKSVDLIHASERQKIVERLVRSGMPEAQAAMQGRKEILPDLERQHLLQNNAESSLGYGVLDGTFPPEHLVPHGPSEEEWEFGCFIFPLSAIRTVELASDGYPVPPVGRTSVEDWEAEFQRSEQEDPYHYKSNPGTKPGPDDRSVVIARRIV